MIRRWPPPEPAASPAGAGALDHLLELADERARLLARYRDERRSEVLHLEIVGRWPRHGRSRPQDL